ncbi:MAG: indole-3-glycerol phosphate synthase TrpC [Firmicutes bacterium]|nr:indole-3-glycerol-phosphate synthase [Alicyclobacillaceae bacterium]MCL6496417.1 indole-3-glycerol phosphate synthase TrpC [Bacillota bacterium]
MFLDDILASARARVAALRQAPDRWQAGWTAPPPRSLLEALRRDAPLAVIAECKQRSPSRGPLAPDGYDPVAIARRYEAQGAAAVSVLTEPHFFGGALEHLRAVREAVGCPVLRKDFLLDPLQVLEARAWGADAVLVIVRILEGDRGRYRELLASAREVGMTALVEVHALDEVDFALAESPALVGVNNRDLQRFETRLEVSACLRPHLGQGVVTVSESGIHSLADAQKVREWGYDAILVGEALMQGAPLLEEIRRWRWR